MLFQRGACLHVAAELRSTLYLPQSAVAGRGYATLALCAHSCCALDCSSQVTFVLHESFTTPKRDVEFPPYELTEVGWGEFDIIVTVHFRVRRVGWGPGKAAACKSWASYNFSSILFWALVLFLPGGLLARLGWRKLMGLVE